MQTTFSTKKSRRKLDRTFQEIFFPDFQRKTSNAVVNTATYLHKTEKKNIKVNFEENLHTNSLSDCRLQTFSCSKICNPRTRREKHDGYFGENSHIHTFCQFFSQKN